MLDDVMSFFLHWGSTSFSLWVASYVFKGIRFADKSSLVISALLLGFANAILRPLIVILTLPITIITLGLFLLVINALMLLLVSALVRGFTISGFWTAFFASIFIGLLSFAIGALIGGDSTPWRPSSNGQWVEVIPSHRSSPPELIVKIDSREKLS